MAEALSRPSIVADGQRHHRHRRHLGAALLCLLLVLMLGIDAAASSVITHGSRERSWVALTFDDGWSKERCARIVRTLRAKNAPATFFINGAIMKRSPTRWRSMLKGFEVASHGLSHPMLDRLSATEIRAQIRVNEQVIERIIRRPILRLLRPPYGAYDRQVVRVADKLGYRTLLWSNDSGDTKAGATTSSVIRNGSRGGNGAIVLLHCGPGMTPAAVGPIIDSYRSRGFKLVGLSKMLGITAPPRSCRVHNLDSGVKKTSLQKAANAASAGDRLTVRGICRGRSTLDKDLIIGGIRTKTSGAPTLAGMDRGTVLRVRPGVTVKLRNLTIRAGAGDKGGGIINRGTLTLWNVAVRGNEATGVGGGILNSGSLTLTGSSSVRGNTTGAEGGGIANSGTLTMAGSSSLRRNSAASPGGGLANSGTLIGVVCDGNVRNNTPDDCAEG